MPLDNLELPGVYWTRDGLTVHGANLSNGQRSSLPPEIATWTGIKNLSLANNRLSSLPHSVSAWTNLEVLYLENNCLSSLPPEASKWTKLESLMLYGNQFSSLRTTNVSAWTNLQWFILTGGALAYAETETPQGFPTLLEISGRSILNANLTSLGIYTMIRLCESCRTLEVFGCFEKRVQRFLCIDLRSRRLDIHRCDELREEAYALLQRTNEVLEMSRPFSQAYVQKTYVRPLNAKLDQIDYISTNPVFVERHWDEIPKLGD